MTAIYTLLQSYRPHETFWRKYQLQIFPSHIRYLLVRIRKNHRIHLPKQVSWAKNWKLDYLMSCNWTQNDHNSQIKTLPVPFVPCSTIKYASSMIPPATFRANYDLHYVTITEKEHFKNSWNSLFGLKHLRYLLGWRIISWQDPPENRIYPLSRGGRIWTRSITSSCSTQASESVL